MHDMMATHRDLFDRTPLGIVIGSAQRTCVDANQVICRMLGFTRNELVGLQASEYVTENAIPAAGLPSDSVKENSGYGPVRQFRRKDGSTFEAETLTTVLPDGTRLEFIRDVANAKLDQLHRDQQFYTRSLIESNIDALVTTDAFAIITDVNRQMVTLSGCTRDELIGAPVKSLFTDPQQAEAGIKRVLREGKTHQSELTVRARDGKLTVVALNASPLYDRHRKLLGTFAAARDMTDQKHYEETLRAATHEAERTNRAILDLNANLERQILERTASVEFARDQLRKSNQRFAIAVDSAGIGIWEFDVVRNSLIWDEWMYRIYGHGPGSDAEPYTLWADSLHPDDRERCEARIMAAVRGEGEFDAEFRIVRPNGEIRHVKAASRTLYAADGSALTMTGVNLDVTEQRRAEEAKGGVACNPSR